MIFEAIQHILTPAAKEVRALGYVREAIAIEARYGRCRNAWESHIGHCHQHILAAADNLAAGSTILIIGSGGLHDVPMEDILAAGFHLILVDIVHLPKIRRRYKNHDRVQFLEQDVSGYVKNLYEQKILSKAKVELSKADLVISLNILSQLPLNLITYAGRHNIALPDDFTQQIMRDHLKILGAGALLISDLERHYGKDGIIIETESALPDLELAAADTSWDWHIAPQGELDKDISLTHQVGCWGIGNILAKAS